MLEKGGAKPKDIYIVGKAYSSHPEVVELLLQRGYQLSFDDVFDYVEDQPYDTVLQKHIIDSTENLLERVEENERGIIIDDGGKAIQLLHQMYPQVADRFACIEQTSRGARTINTLRLSCPVINVARSDAKTQLESPVIAKAMVDEFIQALKRWKDAEAFRLSDKRVLLLGYGFIGENVARELLAQGFDISVYDPDENKLQKAQSQGLSPIGNRSKAFNKVSVLIGASGKPVIQNEEFQLLKPNTLLVNMASTDTEFSAWDLRSKGKNVHTNVLPSDTEYLKGYMPLPWRSLYLIQLPETYIFLANGGFPSDFSGKINPIPADEIQLTAALLLGGAIQAVGAKELKFIDLDLQFQENVIAEYLRLKSQR